MNKQPEKVDWVRVAAVMGYAHALLLAIEEQTKQLRKKYGKGIHNTD